MRKYLVYSAIAIGLIAASLVIIYLPRESKEKRTYKSLAERAPLASFKQADTKPLVASLL